VCRYNGQSLVGRLVSQTNNVLDSYYLDNLKYKLDLRDIQVEYTVELKKPGQLLPRQSQVRGRSQGYAGRVCSRLKQAGQLLPWTISSTSYSRHEGYTGIICSTRWLPPGQSQVQARSQGYAGRIYSRIKNNWAVTTWLITR
jgi:hypothetical protein